MKKVPGHPRLFLRGTTYYHRAAVPKDIKATYPKAEEKKSLGTSDYAEAKRLVRVEAAIADRAFEEHRRKLAQAASKAPQVEELTAEQLDLAERLYYAHLLEEDEDTRLDGFFDPDEAIPALPLPAFKDYSDFNEDLTERTRELYAQGKVDEIFRDEAEEVLTWQGLEVALAQGSPSWKRLVRRLQEATIKAREQIKARNQGEIVPTPASSVPPTPKTFETLASVAMAEWINEKSMGSWSEKTRDEYKVWSDQFLEVVGDKDVTAYTKSDARRFKAVLLKLPPNWVKNSQIRHLPIEEASKRAAELGMAPMSFSNIRKIMNFVGAFWRWAEGNYDDVDGSIFRGLLPKSNTAARDQRNPFTPFELDQIFHAPLYTGCKSLQRYNDQGALVPRSSGYFWVPLIGLYSGMRLSEIIQLECNDVTEVDGVICFRNNQNAPDKKLKTRASERDVPVHPELIRLGLLVHVAAQRQLGRRRVFEDLSGGHDGYYSSPFSKWFSRFLAKVSVKRQTNAFHSFRHNFRDACRACGMPDAAANALIGHAEGGMADRYGAGFTPAYLAQWMEQIHYGDLDLSHLHAS